LPTHAPNDLRCEYTIVDAWAPPLDWGALAVKLANVLGVAAALVGALWVAERGNV